MTTQFKCSKDKQKLEEWANNLVEDYQPIIDHVKESAYQVYESENDTFTIYHGLEIFYN